MKVFDHETDSYTHPRKTFCGDCLGVALEPRDGDDGDLHVAFRIIVEDDGNWFFSNGDASSAWLPDLLEQFQRAHAWMKENCNLDAPNHDEKQDQCPKCGNRSDEYWPWCSPTGPDWGHCLKCQAPSLPRIAFDGLGPGQNGWVFRG